MRLHAGHLSCPAAARLRYRQDRVHRRCSPAVVTFSLSIALIDKAALEHLTASLRLIVPPSMVLRSDLTVTMALVLASRRERLALPSLTPGGSSHTLSVLCPRVHHHTSSYSNGYCSGHTGYPPPLCLPPLISSWLLLSGTTLPDSWLQAFRFPPLPFPFTRC